MHLPKARPAFTLIELLIVIAIIGILAAAVMVAINPGKRTKQARDAARKQDINSIANALIGYYVLANYYPRDSSATGCETSIGVGTSAATCPPAADPPFGTQWYTGIDRLYYSLVTQQGFLKRLPIDPINNFLTYWYSYQPRKDNTVPACDNIGDFCEQYWIGARLEDPQDPTKPIFRCSDYDNLPNGPGCKEVGPDNLLSNVNPVGETPP